MLDATKSLLRFDFFSNPSSQPPSKTVPATQAKLPSMTRPEALELMHAHTPSDSLRRHMLAVETCMRHYAQLQNTDQDQWGIAGLLHDFDYEQHPEDHPLWGMALLQDKNVEPEIIQAIAAHYPAKTGVDPTTPIQRYLFACDELAGLITACVYVRPSRSIMDLETKSVIKKMKAANFAAGVNRDDVTKGADLIGLPLNDHIKNMIDAMKQNADELGLNG